MEELKEAKIWYYENEIAHLEQQKYVYEQKLEFYTRKLNETCDEIVKHRRTIRDIIGEDHVSELEILKKKFAENKENVLDNMKLLSDDSLSLARYEAYMRRLKGEQ